MYYCFNCSRLTNASRCPTCASKALHAPRARDFCYLTEKETIWVNALEDLFTENGIPFVTRNVLGAGLAAKIGPALERVRFYVPYSHYQTAQALEAEFFRAEPEDTTV